MNKPQLTDVRGIGPAKAKTLIENGIGDVDDLLHKPIDQITGLPGFTQAVTRQVRAHARLLWNRWQQSLPTAEMPEQLPAESAPDQEGAVPEVLPKPAPDGKTAKKDKDKKGKKDKKSKKDKDKTKKDKKDKKDKKPKDKKDKKDKKSKKKNKS